MKDKKYGIGTLAFVFAIIPVILTTSVNGVSLTSLILEAANISLSPYMFLAGLVLSVPGFIIGITHRNQWGAKFGMVVCALSILQTIAQVIYLLVA